MSRFSGVTKNDKSGYFLTQSEPARYSGVDEELSEDHVFLASRRRSSTRACVLGQQRGLHKGFVEQLGVSSAEITVAKGSLSS